MKFGFVTLFPELVQSVMQTSIVGRALKAGLITVECSNPRDFATDVHRTVDDNPYGGGPGMVMKVDVVAKALRSLWSTGSIVLMDPAAPIFTQADAAHFALENSLIFICGHYEGVDERVRSNFCTNTFSVGDFVMTGGELPALCVADSVTRLLPRVLGDPVSHQDDSFQDGLLGAPAYTRPPEWEGYAVPDVLLSGDHRAIAKWRRTQQLSRTRNARPDLLIRAGLKRDDLDLL